MKREAATRNVVIDDKRREVLVAEGSRPISEDTKIALLIALHFRRRITKVSP